MSECNGHTAGASVSTLGTFPQTLDNETRIRRALGTLQRYERARNICTFEYKERKVYIIDFLGGVVQI